MLRGFPAGVQGGYQGYAKEPLGFKGWGRVMGLDLGWSSTGYLGFGDRNMQISYKYMGL